MAAVNSSIWQETVDRLSQLLVDVTPATIKRGLPPELAGLLKEVTEQASLWPVKRSVFTFGQLDADKCILLCRAGLLPWWMPLTGRIVRGELGAAEKIHQAALQDAGKGGKPSLDSALTWLAYPSELAPGYATKNSPEMIRQLLKWGANPNHSDGKWLEQALRLHKPDCIKPFLERGAAPEIIQRVMDALHKEQNFTQLGRVQEALARNNSYKVDAETLMEEKYVPDAKGGTVLKTVFNFQARRVQEIYESAPGAPVVNTVPFAAYDAAALTLARDKLVRLGGSPRELETAPEKPRLAKPAVIERV